MPWEPDGVRYIPYNGDIMVIYRGEEWYWYWYDIDRNATQKIDIWSDIISDFSEMIWSDIISEKMWYLTPLPIGLPDRSRIVRV